MMRERLHRFQEPVYRVTLELLYPFNWFLSYLLRNVKYEDSVLHISFMVHIPYYTVRMLRRFGLKADYLATGSSPYWDRCDYQVPSSRWPFVRAFKEFLFFWRVVSKYEVIHSHFVTTMSSSGWELKFLKRLGRKIIIHYRGCEIRDRKKNMGLHPECNICQDCDYDGICLTEAFRQKRRLAKKYGDLFLVTTPDLKDFALEAIHLPLFAPEIEGEENKELETRQDLKTTRIVHVTVHPGIEGTARIRQIVERLIHKGYPIHFILLHNIPHERALEEFSKADLSIGKMKMGYYANAQIEAMTLGVPTITYVRPEFMTEELKASGFIITDLEHLGETLQYYLDHPNKLEEKRKIAKTSILALHNNEKIIRELIRHYTAVKMNWVGLRG